MDTVTTIATVPAIVAIVNLIKGLGLDGKLSALVAVLLGVLLSIAVVVGAGNPIFDAAAQGLLLGLAAAGLYDLTPGRTGTVEDWEA